MSKKNIGNEIVDERASVYGPPEESFARIAQAWSAILGIEVRADQVPLCMIALKLVRASETPDYSDNIDDVEGYADIFRKVVGDQMIQARTATEYYMLRAHRDSESITEFLPEGA